MARPAGSGKEYQTALKTVAGELKLEEFSIDNLDVALAKIKDLMGASSPAISMAACKFIIEQHARFAKQHGKNPKPADFIIDKEVTIFESEDEGNNIIDLKFHER